MPGAAWVGRHSQTQDAHTVDYRFQVNLQGIIALLSNNLYSGPRVFMRELLQNAVDAIHARQLLDPAFKDGRIDLELIHDAPAPPTLVFQDDGVGLTEEEVHRFLATIGESSKRDDLGAARTDFIGQFGIGLLSCFMVADEIVMITQSARPGATPVEWRGKPDGTYTVRALAGGVHVGTRVYLRCKAGAEEYFAPEAARDLARHFGGLLPHPIRVANGRHSWHVNDEPPPWRRRFHSIEAREQALLDYGQNVFGTDFFDAIPLESAAGGVEGVAFVLPFSPSPAAKATHRVYLKNMLLSESAEGLLPEWAFFVRCVVNASALRPNASREAFYEDAALAATRDQLGRVLRSYLLCLAREDRPRLERLIALHHLAIKALAVHDDEFFRIFIDWVPFETSMGTMTLPEYRKRSDTVRYAPTVDQFRQIARVAQSQDLCVINAGYTYNEELLLKLGELDPDLKVEVVDAGTLAQAFDELTLDEREQCFELVRAADLALRRFRVAAEVKKFRPPELPTLYNTSRDAYFYRAAQQAGDLADEHWAGVLDNLADEDADNDDDAGPVPHAHIFFNYNSALVRKLATLRDAGLLTRCVEMLYVQSLLLGHHPLTAGEMDLLNTGLLGLIDRAIDPQKPEGK